MNGIRLQAWFKERRQEVLDRWHAELRAGRSGELGDNGLLRAVLAHLSALLPLTLGSRKEEAEELWQSSAHFYGTFAFLRGLVAGEVVEELELLRAVILRMLLPDMVTQGGADSRLLRDVLLLNRILDTAVVQASVSYVDDLIFAHLQGSGVPAPMTGELQEELRRQLENLEGERESLGNGDGGAS